MGEGRAWGCACGRQEGLWCLPTGMALTVREKAADSVGSGKGQWMEMAVPGASRREGSDVLPHGRWGQQGADREGNTWCPQCSRDQVWLVAPGGGTQGKQCLVPTTHQGLGYEGWHLGDRGGTAEGRSRGQCLVPTAQQGPGDKGWDPGGGWGQQEADREDNI